MVVTQTGGLLKPLSTAGVAAAIFAMLYVAVSLAVDSNIEAGVLVVGIVAAYIVSSALTWLLSKVSGQAGIVVPIALSAVAGVTTGFLG